LRATHFTFDKATFCSWLGVTHYLTAAAIEATLAFVLMLPHGSEIVFSFILPQDALSGIEADAMAIAAGEPWLTRFHPADLVLQLRRRAFPTSPT
jgi:O-methyltransferase involved in polyketide biosynthesis